MACFSSLHHNELVNQFWNRGSAECPHDGAKVDAHFHSHGTGYLLVLACVRCGKKVQVTRFSDPLRRTFRPWSTAEIATLVAAKEAGHAPACPVCQTAVVCQVHAPSESLFMECRRCGNVHRGCITINAGPLAELAG